MGGTSSRLGKQGPPDHLSRRLWPEPKNINLKQKSDLKPKLGLKKPFKVVNLKNVYDYCLYAIKTKLLTADQLCRNNNNCCGNNRIDDEKKSFFLPKLYCFYFYCI